MLHAFHEPSVDERSSEMFEDLIEAFNTMGEELEHTRNTVLQTMEELSDSRNTLEGRVQARTRELEQALDKVQVLSGFLPIYSSCKKIRGDQGYWQQVEKFVQDHSSARFTQGFCPDCVTDLYGSILASDKGLKK